PLKITTAATPIAFPPATLAPATPAPTAAAPTAASEKPSSKLVEIKSETPGTFYAKPKPEEPPFVQRGSKVKPDTVIGLIEAMKLFNEIHAGVSGIIAEILVENRQPFEYGQVRFRVDPAG